METLENSKKIIGNSSKILFYGIITTPRNQPTLLYLEGKVGMIPP